MLRSAWSGVLAVALGATGLSGCTVTVPVAAPEVTVRWWYYPDYDVYFRGGLWWYYGLSGWVAVDTLPAWIVLPPTALRLHVDVPHRAPPYTRWSDHRIDLRRRAPHTWQPRIVPTAPRASHPARAPERAPRRAPAGPTAPAPDRRTRPVLPRPEEEPPERPAPRRRSKGEPEWPRQR